MITGSVLFPYFLKWVESPLGANAGSTWTEEHIESFVNIAGPMMGVPKAITAMLSGKWIGERGNKVLKADSWIASFRRNT